MDLFAMIGRTTNFLAGLLALVHASSSVAQSVVRLDPALDDLISIDATVVPLYRDPNGFFEGPSWVGGRAGYLVFSDVPGNRLMKIDQRKRISVLVSDVQRVTPRKPLHDGLYTNRDLVGTNGTLVANKNNLYVAQFGGASIDAIDLSRRIVRTVVTGQSDPKFVFPNDLAFGPGGEAYFTAHEGIFRIHDGKAVLVRAQSANGLAFAPSCSFLYATDGVSRILKIDLNEDGWAGDAEVFADTMGDPAKHQFLDGLKVDSRGNLWAVAPDGIWIFDSTGKVLGRILAPTVTMPTGEYHRFTNLAFGGRHGSVLYLTAPGGVYSIQLKSRLTISAGDRHRCLAQVPATPEALK